MIKVLLVCLGNICRSPTAHGLFQAQVEQAGLVETILVDSAGTGDWHIGRPPDKRAQATAKQRGYDISHLQARQVSRADFEEFDYILGMDRENMHNLRQLAPVNYQGTLGLFLAVAGVGDLEVPDPYYGDQAHFDDAINLVEKGAAGLLEQIRRTHDL